MKKLLQIVLTMLLATAASALSAGDFALIDHHRVYEASPPQSGNKSGGRWLSASYGVQNHFFEQSVMITSKRK